LERLLLDREWRIRAVERGLRQAARFSWARCVEETVAVYREALAAGR
jgi:alpha-1,3-rhamnosyl/mannosyltransferase